MKKTAKKEAKPKQSRESVDECKAQWDTLDKPRKGQIYESLIRCSEAHGPQSFSVVQQFCRNAIPGSVHWITGREIAGALAFLETKGIARLTRVGTCDYWFIARKE